ncbi:formate dehydrogenase gamma subunit [Cupriavidus sp. YR651]|uniref:formate dehydrogenase subunit gamma n=1 Tax=Cupriavidus sp. YR651 TaxID=1855315 RepID=UPI0008839435|nr:formate dehydrogenase subunit gamma [Cupriavidus sp. YR651]SDC48938.1 formate dehydrogenase gamma subunit [Cupriavidus sp. YR651]
MPDIATPTAPADGDAIARIVAARRDMPGALLPILHDIQDSQGFIPAEAVPVIAKALNLSRAEVHGVITFYHHFRDQPAGRHVVQVCRAEACQSVGADALAAHASKALGCDFHETTADGQFTLEPVYCLGQCACGPAVMIGDRLHARVDARRFDALTGALREPAVQPAQSVETQA